MVPFKRLTVGPLVTNCYILFDEAEEICAVIDPGGDADIIIKEVNGSGFKPVHIIDTHGHFDHTEANGAVAAALGLPVSIHEEDLQMLTDASLGSPFLPYDDAGVGLSYEVHKLKDGDLIDFGDCPIEVLHTPGHTPGSISLCWRDNLFVGDLLFRGSIGRTDLPGGSFEQMKNSLEKIGHFPGDTEVMPGHDGPTTIAMELKDNPYLLELRGHKHEQD